ncbi:MAG: TldD/PmbA family protein [Alphaproteobacteria bacterium]|nr:TldD/PmbA family protein [Alphaproteobacteria bacterium]
MAAATPSPMASSCRSGSAFALDRGLLYDLADIALTAAQQNGANYADLRIGETRREYAFAKDDRLENFDERESQGFGLRVLLDGCWGFYGARRLDPHSLRDGVERALENARAVKPIQLQPIELERLPVHEAEWIMPMGVDPFDVPASKKADLLLSIIASARDHGADFCTASLSAVCEERFFANSLGSRIHQTRTRVAPSFQAAAVDRAKGRFATRDCLTPARGAGWEYVVGAGLIEEAARAGAEARAKLDAKTVTGGDYDIVIDPTNLWLTIHETVGHSTELDRVLGWEANFAGTSFVKPHMLDELRFGSELMTIVADRAQPGALATIGYDDDGAAAKAAEFAIVERGVFKNFQMALGQAHFIGLSHSNGCAYADSPTAFPIQRMPNISLKPNPQKCSFNDLISDVKNGIYVVGAGSWSIDQQRDNFQFGGQLFYEIKNGRLGDLLRDGAYQGRTTQFWNSLAGLCDASAYHLDGTFTCGKAEPVQLAPVSHGSPPALFRNVRVLNTSDDA